MGSVHTSPEYLRWTMKTLLSFVILSVFLTLGLAFDCPMKGINFQGSDLGVQRDVQSWQECGELCQAQAAAGCLYWTWNSEPASDEYGDCYTKYSDEGLTSDEDWISGEEACPQ